MPSKVATTSPLSVVSPSTSTPTILTTSTTSNTTTSSATSSTKPSPPSVTQKPLITPITPRAPSVGVLLPNIVPEEVSSQLQLVTGLFRDLARSDCTTDWGTCARIISHWLQLFSIDSTTETLENGCDLSDALRYMYPCAKITPVRRCSHLFHAVSNWAQLLDALHSELHIKIVNLFADDLAAGVNSRKQIVSVARLLMNLHLITLKALL
ncbi:hypothetical protein Pelo_5775 [Pelomyxa schiedti]|nr:hypothetical protein Pelo_5775 [Pelomyxa schiedti]